MTLKRADFDPTLPPTYRFFSEKENGHGGSDISGHADISVQYIQPIAIL